MSILQPSCHEHLAEMHTWARDGGTVLIMQKKGWRALVGSGCCGADRPRSGRCSSAIRALVHRESGRGILAYVVLQQFVVPLVGRDA